MRPFQNKRFVLSVAMLFLSLSLFVFSVYAWFTLLEEQTYQANVGFVQVDLDAYFDDGLGGRNEAIEVPLSETVSKSGVYLINIVSSSSTNYFEDFRLHVHVSSNVDTYFRIRIYEQLTLTYTNFEGIVTELSILMVDYMDFNYESTNWYDNRIVDDYIYYSAPVQRVDALTYLDISLIDSYYLSQNFSNYPPGYSLQIAFSIEAVQANQGPENVWGLATPPWGGTW